MEGLACADPGTSGNSKTITDQSSRHVLCTFFLLKNHTKIFVHLLSFWSELKPHAIFHNPRTTPSGRKVTGSEKRGTKKHVNSGRSACNALGQHMHFAQTIIPYRIIDAGFVTSFPDKAMFFAASRSQYHFR